MDCQEALEIAMARTKHEPLRKMASPDRPGHEAICRHLIEVAGDDPGPAPVSPETSYPSVAQQARNLWRSIKAFVASGGRLVPKAVRAERARICRACPHWNGITCGKCGCTKLKVWSAAEKCPDNPPRWGTYEGEV
jgi:hypothetical protein